MIRWRKRKTGNSTAMGLVGTVGVHAVAASVLVTSGAGLVETPPVYRVSIVAAPPPARQRAPEALERQAQQPAPTVPTRRRPPRNTASETPPPPQQTAEQREAAPRTTRDEEPLPTEDPSTGTGPATVETPGKIFSHPEYLENLVAEVQRRWRRPQGKQKLEAEIQFFVHRDGSISNPIFIRRSGNFAFDLEAQGAIEAAGRAKVFGPLPEDYAEDILLVSFFFAPQGRR